jgi:type I restriction enzyme R subunit
MRKAFDSDEYHVMIVAQKFQTGFDQPKLCAMYVDKKLGGVECVQTLSRLNRVHPGKEETYVLDFVNDPEEIVESFQEYYQTAKLIDVSDPNLIWDLKEKIQSAGIFTMVEVNLFVEVFFTKSSKSNAAISNVCKPAVERWQYRYGAAYEEHQKRRDMFERIKKTGDAVLVGNAENDLKEAKKELDALGMFKADLVSFTRYYEFMSQIVDFDSTDLEKLSLYARHLAPLLREKTPKDDAVDLSSVELSHYRLSKLKQQDLKLVKGGSGGLVPGSEMGSGKAKSKMEEYLSQIIHRLNEVFVTEGLTDNDMLNYAMTISDKVRENKTVMKQIENNSRDQAMLGDFPNAIDDAVMESSEAHRNQMTQILNSPEVAAGFRRIVLDILRSPMNAARGVATTEI